jgi:hypothetical protein
MFIKQRLGGSVKGRAGSNSYRYRLHNIDGMKNLIHRINGNIRNSKRIPQLERVCLILGIHYLSPITLTLKNSWFSGFFDADGSITTSFKNVNPVVVFCVSNKKKEDLIPFLIFGGNIYYDKSGYGHFVWYLSKKDDIFKMYEYFKEYPLHSHKMFRFYLIKKFYLLKKLKAHKHSNNTPLYNSWNNLKFKWMKWE